MLKHFRVAWTSIEKKLNYYSNHNTNNERKFTITLIAKHKNNFSWDKKECLLYKKRPGQSADQNKNIIYDQDHTKMLWLLLLSVPILWNLVPSTISFLNICKIIPTKTILSATWQVLL